MAGDGDWKREAEVTERQLDESRRILEEEAPHLGGKGRLLEEDLLFLEEDLLLLEEDLLLLEEDLLFLEQKQRCRPVA